MARGVCGCWKALVERLVQTQSQDRLSHLQPQLREAYTQLIQNEVAEEMAAEFICRINDQQADGGSLDRATINEFLVQQFARVPQTMVRRNALS